MTAHAHRWSDWLPVARDLLERRCACGDVERATYDAVNGDELDRLKIVLTAWRRVFGTEERRR
jgi:hypothetical protein